MENTNILLPKQPNYKKGMTITNDYKIKMVEVGKHQNKVCTKYNFLLEPTPTNHQCIIIKIKFQSVSNPKFDI